MRSIFALLVGPITLQHVVDADALPCSATSLACCNPFVTPPQMCPGNVECEACGGSGACECPGQAPAPPPGPSTTLGPASYNRLTIVNGCESESLWVAHIVAGGVGPDPQDVKICPGCRESFATSAGSGALSATRFWPKLGCDESGNNCDFGDSGGPGEGCVIRIPGKDDNYTQCAPPVDTKFEASFAPPGSSSMDVLDMSLVDGYTLPFKLETSEGSCSRHVEPFESMDCSGLSLAKCPTRDVLGGNAYDMQAVNPTTGKLGGCYSPCMRLTDDKWNTTMPVSADSFLASPYCCAGAYGNPGECTTGPIYDTAFLPAVKAMCPDAYAYAYDDKIATIACTTATKYTVTFFCPVFDEQVVA